MRCVLVRSWPAALLLAALPLLGSACRGQAASTPGASVDVQVDPSPAVVGSIQLTVRLTGSGGQPIDGAVVRVVAEMTHAGMPPTQASATPARGGRYVARDLALSMAGDWVLTVEATLPAGGTVTRAVNLRGVRSSEEAPATPEGTMRRSWQGRSTPALFRDGGAR